MDDHRWVWRDVRIYFAAVVFNLFCRAWKKRFTTANRCARFTGIELGQDEVRMNEILNFRICWERHGLTKNCLPKVQEHLQQQGLSLRSGTIVDATIITAPRLDKNSTRRTSPRWTSTRKGRTGFRHEIARGHGLGARLGAQRGSDYGQSPRLASDG